MWKIKRFFRWLKWLVTGRKMIIYTGYMCGLCGKGVREPFAVPEWDSDGAWWDTIGMCDACRKEK